MRNGLTHPVADAVPSSSLESGLISRIEASCTVCSGSGTSTRVTPVSSWAAECLDIMTDMSASSSGTAKEEAVRAPDLVLSQMPY